LRVSIHGESEAEVLNETLQNGLKPYQIGEKLRALRLKKSMGLVELGQHTGLSAALLSKLERGKLFPTLPTLLRIAMVFGLGLDYFFTDERKRHIVSIVRKEERKRFPERPGSADNSYFFESLDFKANERSLNGYFAEFEIIAPEKQKTHQHAGYEFLYVVHGKLILRIGADEHELKDGDAIYFDSGVPHTYRRGGKMPCSAVVITTQ
jgi:transcriptional regulator with XRE-family HTH domain